MMAAATPPAPSAPVAAAPGRDGKKLAARLEGVAGCLVALTKKGHGKKLRMPILGCVRELRAVWAALRACERVATNSPALPAAAGAQLAQAAGAGLASARARALHDRLTRVLSRAAFHQRLMELASQDAAFTGKWCVAVADIDRFSQFNRQHGSRVGDALLLRVAEAIERTCETYPGAIVGRCGGEEFGILLPRCALREGRRMAEETRAVVANTTWPCSRRGGPAFMSATVSIGLAEHRPAESAEEVLRRARYCMERAKRAGRNVVVVERGGALPHAARPPAKSHPAPSVCH